MYCYRHLTKKRQKDEEVNVSKTTTKTKDENERRRRKTKTKDEDERRKRRRSKKEQKKEKIFSKQTCVREGATVAASPYLAIQPAVRSSAVQGSVLHRNITLQESPIKYR